MAPQSTALLKFYPLPNFPESAGYNYQVPLVGITHQDDVQGRVNKMLNRKHFVNGSFAYRNARSSGPNVFGFDDTGHTTGFNASATWRYMASQRLNFSLGYQFSRMTMRTTPYFANRENVSGEAGITGNNQDPGNWGPPNLSFSSGIAALSDAALSLTRNQTSGVSFTGLLDAPAAQHHLRRRFPPAAIQPARRSRTRAAAFTFTGAATGNDFADFLLGVPDTSAIAFGNADKYFRAASYDAYFTDDWRVGPGLTLNAGAALGIQLAHRGEIWPAGEPGRRAGICGGSAGAGQQPHGPADRAAVSRFAGAARQARIPAARGARVAPASSGSSMVVRGGIRHLLQHLGLSGDCRRRWRSNRRCRRA